MAPQNPSTPPPLPTLTFTSPSLPSRPIHLPTSQTPSASVHNFTSSAPVSSHRLPTISAAAALAGVSKNGRGNAVSTGLAGSDRALGGGLRKGEVSEMWGPPGCGKTIFGMQLAANALHDGGEVIWIDTATPLCGPRLSQIISSPIPPSHQNSTASSPPDKLTSTELLHHFHHHTTPTLPHLLALLSFLSSLPPPYPSLLIIDTITLFFPRPPALKPSPSASQQWASSRRFAVMSELLSRLMTYAATRNSAVLLISQSSLSIKGEERAVLRPGISTKAWDEGVRTRMVVFRDWGREGEERTENLRFVGVQKSGGVGFEGVGKVVGFYIEIAGLREVGGEGDGSVDMRAEDDVVDSSRSIPLHVVVDAGPVLKRKRDEIADSDEEGEEIGSDEEFGWLGEEDLAHTGIKEL